VTSLRAGEEPNPDELEMAQCLGDPSPGRGGAPGGTAQQQQQQPGGGASREGDSQEESLMLELADEEEVDDPPAGGEAGAGDTSQQEQQQQQGLAPPPSGLELEVDDDDLLELAAAGLSQPDDTAAASSPRELGHPLAGEEEPTGEPGAAQPLQQPQRDTNSEPEEIGQAVPGAAAVLGTEASSCHQVDLLGTEQVVGRAYALVRARWRSSVWAGACDQHPSVMGREGQSCPVVYLCSNLALGW